MATKKGVWNLQQVRDKQLQSLWEYNPSILFKWANSGGGTLGNNGAQGSDENIKLSSPTQVASGKIWNYASINKVIGYGILNGTLWAWGNNHWGAYGNNAQGTHYSSPVQIGSDTTWKQITTGYQSSVGAVKTDGTLWAWGYNAEWGQLGLNDKTTRSSPTQIPGTTWSHIAWGYVPIATKTDGTLWSWGYQYYGTLGQNEGGGHKVSSPVQVPGTTWSQGNRKNGSSTGMTMAIRTDGTLWAWGNGDRGQLGTNETGIHRSSPTQIPGTTWSKVLVSQTHTNAIKTDGTLWAWGNNTVGELGQNDVVLRSSPVQIPGTTWHDLYYISDGCIATKSDGTLWSWGANTDGDLGVNDVITRSSPVQIPGSWNLELLSSEMYGTDNAAAMQVQ